MGNPHRQPYPENVRNFCISLNNTSPAAYRLTRKQFDDRIPAPVTLRAWHSNSDINPTPGILKQSLTVLKRKVVEQAANNQIIYGGLSFDETHIHSMLQYANNKMIGYEHLPGLDMRDAKLATQALVFMFNAINDNLKILVAYYFVGRADADSKYHLVESVLRAVLECGVDVKAITFDGHRSNPAACHIFGANLDVLDDNFDPSFKIGEKTIHIIYDPSHLIKLWRGAISKGKIFDADNNRIDWKYFERLVLYGKKSFNVTHKMTKAHIEWASDPMKVILAVETLSASTADSMQYLLDQGHPGFAGAEGTIRYIRICDDIFDIFNSTTQRTSENPLKKMMSVENFANIMEVFDKTANYMKGLQSRTEKRGRLVPLCRAPIKTGFQGCVINIKSLTAIYQELVGENHISHIPVHSLSQDHLEVS